MPRLAILAALALSLATAFARPSFACSCDGPLTPCAAFDAADAVFVGRVVDVTPSYEEASRVAPIGSDASARVAVRFAVDDAYKGVSGDEVTVHTGAGNGDCGYVFGEGESYFVYAYAREAKLYTGHCTRTRALADADDDLEYVRSIGDPKATGRVKGVAVIWRDGSYPEEEREKSAAMSGVTVVLDGSGASLRTTADDDGNFAFSGLAPGAYRIHAIWPPSLKDAGPLAELNVVGGCTIDLRLAATASSRLVGRCVDAGGDPMKDVTVHVLRDGASENDERYAPAARTDGSGAFAFDALPPGRYRLRVGELDTPSTQFPYDTVYAPGVARREDAAIFEVRPGASVAEALFRFPEPKQVVTLRGVVVWDDGSPVSHATVYLVDPTNEIQRDQAAETDDSGAFAIAALAGVTYGARAYVTVGSEQPRATPVRVVARPGGARIRLVLPRPADAGPVGSDH